MTRFGIIVALVTLLWTTEALPSAAFVCIPSSTTHTRLQKSRGERKRSSLHTFISPSEDYTAVLSKYGLSTEQSSPFGSTLPGSAQHKIRQSIRYVIRKSMQLGIITLISRLTNNRLRLGVNVVRWALLSVLFLFLKWQTQLAVMADGIGFVLLQERYQIIDDDTEADKYEVARIVHVPGNGSCLFYALAASLLNFEAEKNKCTSSWSWSDVHNRASELRKVAVDTLEDKDSILCITDRDSVLSSDLVNAVSSWYGLTSEQYCRNMRRPSCWGGGPEIIALSNALERPIHIYEACDTSSSTTPCAATRDYTLNESVALYNFFSYGSPQFAREGLHILFSRNHFSAVFPE